MRERGWEREEEGGRMREGGSERELYVIIVSKSVGAKMPHKEENPIILCNKYPGILNTNRKE